MLAAVSTELVVHMHSKAEGEHVFSVGGLSLARFLRSPFLSRAHSRLGSLKYNNNLIPKEQTHVYGTSIVLSRPSENSRQ